LGDELPNGDMFLYLKSCEGEGDNCPPAECQRIELEGGFLFHDLTKSKKKPKIGPDEAYQIPGGRLEKLGVPRPRIPVVNPVETGDRDNISPAPLNTSPATVKIMLPPIAKAKPNQAASACKKNTKAPWIRNLFGGWLHADSANHTAGSHSNSNSGGQKLNCSQSEKKVGPDVPFSYMTRPSYHASAAQSTTKTSFPAIVDTDSMKKVHVTASFRIDPKFSFLPDWVLYSMLKSSAYTVLSMLDWQAKMFQPGSLYHCRLHHARYASTKEMLGKHSTAELRGEDDQPI
jgi:hypothetical protein